MSVVYIFSILLSKFYCKNSFFTFTIEGWLACASLMFLSLKKF